MNFSAENFLLIGSILLFVSIVAGKTGYRFGVPSLLLFLAVGMLFGNEGVGLEFSSFKQAQFIGMTALSVILFSGGMDTREDEIKPVMLPGIILSTAGVILTALFTGLFIYFLTLSWPSVINLPLAGCFLLAAVMSSTDSASVFSVLRARGLNLKQNVRPLLELESGSNDPMAYMLTIMLISYIKYSNLSIDVLLWTLVIQFVLGLVFGYLLGRAAVFVINHLNLDYTSLYSILLLSFALFAFSFTNMLNGNGYLAVYIAGLVIGNSKVMFKKSVVLFFDGMAWLFQIIMFLTLGLLVEPHKLLGVALVASLIGLFLILVGRPLSVYLCLKPFKSFSPEARKFISWVGLRGAVPIIFASYPYVAGIEGADLIFDTVFFITIISLIIQGTTVPSYARKLGLADNSCGGKQFAIELPSDLAVTSEITVTPQLLEKGGKLCNIELPADALIMMIKRGDKFFIPNHKTEILENDKLLVIATTKEELQDAYAKLGIEHYEIYKN